MLVELLITLASKELKMILLGKVCFFQFIVFITLLYPISTHMDILINSSVAILRLLHTISELYIL